MLKGAIMNKEKLLDRLERQHWLQPVEDTVQSGTREVFASGGETGRRVQQFLHGKWLGHPLHAAITDIPVGAWSAAVTFDAIETITGTTRLQSAADAAIAVGLAGGVGAAATGLTDWHVTSGEARRAGFIHGVTNITAFTLFATSLAARKRGARGLGRLLSAAGFALALGGAWLGGHLVYHYNVGVDAGDSTLDRPAESRVSNF
jgi:uncharacterized membrane protein